MRQVRKSPGKTMNHMPVAEFGVTALAWAAAHQGHIKENLTSCRLVRASVKGLGGSDEELAEAAKSAKVLPLSNAKLLRSAPIPCAFAPFPPAWGPDRLDGTGGLDRHDRHAQVVHGLASAAPVTDYYTNDFVPAEMGRSSVAEAALRQGEQVRPRPEGTIRIENWEKLL